MLEFPSQEANGRVILHLSQSAPELKSKQSPSYRIVNTVLSTRVNGSVDIERLAMAMPGTQYEPGIFPGLIMRRPDLDATLIIFATGRYVANAPSVRSARDALRKVADEISNIEGHTILIESPRIENMVATTDMGLVINLERLSMANSCCIYEPEQFPAAICRLKGSLVLLVFKSGKVNCVGAKSEQEISNGISWLKQSITRFPGGFEC